MLVNAFEESSDQLQGNPQHQFYGAFHPISQTFSGYGDSSISSSIGGHSTENSSNKSSDKSSSIISDTKLNFSIGAKNELDGFKTYYTKTKENAQELSLDTNFLMTEYGPTQITEHTLLTHSYNPLALPVFYLLTKGVFASGIRGLSDRKAHWSRWFRRDL